MILLVQYLIRKWRQRRLAVTFGRRDDSTVSAARGRPRRTAGGGASPIARGFGALLRHQVRYDLRASLRNPRARFATFLFPIILLVVFTGVFGNGHTTIDGVQIKLSRFYVPGVLAMALVVTAYASLVVSVATARETGVLKRRRATPVPAAVLIGGQVLTTVMVAAMMATLLLVIAKLAYGIGMAPGALVAIAVTAVVGTITFACLGYAVAGLIGSPEAAQPIVQATMLPLWFISGVFIPTANLSSGLRSVASLFPVEHLANALHVASINASFTSAISVGDLLVLGAWAVAAGGFAAWRFSWLPSTASP